MPRTWDPLVRLGPPFDRYAAALLRADAARRAHHAAVVAGDRDAARRALLDRDEAIGDAYRVKEDEAAKLGMALRFHAELHGPGGLLILLGLPADLAERLENLEAAVSTLLADRGDA